MQPNEIAAFSQNKMKAKNEMEEAGRLDCKNGVPHEDGMGKDYDMAYGMQYQLEQLEAGRFNPPDIDQYFKERGMKQ